MALDFGSYLLSSSPPGFEFIRLKNFQFSSVNDGDFPRCRKKDLSVKGFETNVCSPLRFDDLVKEHCEKLDTGPDKPHWQNIEVVDDRTKVPDQKPFEKSRISDWENVYGCDPENCDCGSKRRAGKVKHKNVTFADDLGRMLAEIRIMQEPSDIPPDLRPEVLSKFVSPSSSNSAPVGSDGGIHLSINFPQPAANYLVFREKLEQCSVSLENAVVRNTQLFGTVKVKNRSYDKRAFVRCTFDGWVSFSDYPATYSNSNNACFDTFSFQIDVPSDLNPGKLVQFAVCFVSDGVEFWDNNDGKNYEVTHSHHSCGEETPDRSSARGLFALDGQDSWSDFTGFSEEPSSPYW